MKQTITDFVTGEEFKDRFNIPFIVLDGSLRNYKKDYLPDSSGIYFIYSDDLGLSYIGMTERSVRNRFDKHVGRAKGKDYDKKNPHKVWNYFHQWCKESGHDYESQSKYLFVSFQDNIESHQLEWLENSAIYKFSPLLNDVSFECFGFNKLENMKPQKEPEETLFKF